MFTELKVSTVKREKLEQMNPPKYEKCDDMADLTYLNDATILHNLRARYLDFMIYVSLIIITKAFKNNLTIY